MDEILLVISGAFLGSVFGSTLMTVLLEYRRRRPKPGTVAHPKTAATAPPVQQMHRQALSTVRPSEPQMPPRPTLATGEPKQHEYEVRVGEKPKYTGDNLTAAKVARKQLRDQGEEAVLYVDGRSRG